jgi:hypothetical protein
MQMTSFKHDSTMSMSHTKMNKTLFDGEIKSQRVGPIKILNRPVKQSDITFSPQK